MDKSLRVGITGATSVLGFSLARRLLNIKGWEVYAIIRDKNSKTVKHLLGFQRFHPILGSVTDRHTVKEFVNSVDVVFHLAALSSERLCSAKPDEAVSVNIGSTALVAEHAGKKGISMVFSSSAAVYENGYFPREESPLTTKRIYGFTKWIAEEILQTIASRTKLSFSILRFSRIYGVGMRRNPVYDIFRAWQRNEAVILYDSLHSCYDFLYVEDAIDALIYCIENEEMKGQVVNIGTGKGVYIEDVVSTSEKVLGAKLKVNIDADAKPKFDVLNTDKMQKLGLRINFQLRDGLSDMVRLGKEIGFI